MSGSLKVRPNILLLYEGTRSSACHEAVLPAGRRRIGGSMWVTEINLLVIIAIACMVTLHFPIKYGGNLRLFQ